MNNHKSIYVFFGILLLGSIGIGLFFIFQTYGAGSSTVSGRVFKVTDRLGSSEPYYGLSVQAANGTEYVVDGTGSMSKDQTMPQHTTCLDMPHASVGDKVSFNLPRSTSYAHTYVTCYDEATTGYFIRVE